MRNLVNLGLVNLGLVNLGESIFVIILKIGFHEGLHTFL